MSLTQIGPPFLTSSSLDHETMRPGDHEKLSAQSSELRDGPVPERVGGDGEKARQAYMTETHTETRTEREREREREGTRDRMALGVGAWTMERESATEEANGSPREENGGEKGRGSTQGSFHGQPSQGPRLRFDVMLRKAREHQGTKGRELQDEGRPRVPVRYMVRPL